MKWKKRLRERMYEMEEGIEGENAWNGRRE